MIRATELAKGRAGLTRLVPEPVLSFYFTTLSSSLQMTVSRSREPGRKVGNGNQKVARALGPGTIFLEEVPRI